MTQLYLRPWHSGGKGRKGSCCFCYVLSNSLAIFVTLKWVKVVQPCLTLRPHGLHGILQASILEWVAFPFSRGSSQRRDWTQISHIAGNCLPAEPQEKPKAQVTLKGWIHLTWTYNLNNWRFTNYLSTFGRKHIYFLASNCNSLYNSHQIWN